MRLIGRPSQHDRGVGSIIGAVFVALILLSGLTFYALTQGITQHYNDTMSSMSDMDWNRNQENVVIKQIAITSTNKLNVTAENDGPVQSHLIWLGIFNKTATPENQTYQALNEYVRPGEIDNVVSNFSVISGNMYVVQLVTESGNVVESRFYPASFVSCALTLVAAPPTVYQGNNVTVLFTVTPNDTAVDSIQSLAVTLNATPANLVQLVGNSSLSVSGLSRGTSAFFWWSYNAVNTGTVAFNATYLQAPAGTYALLTAEIVGAPQQGGQGNVTITGINCTASQNPSQWRLLGSTQNVNGSISDLASNDTNYAVFSSYNNGTNINHFVDSNSSNVDNATNVGTQSNFTVLQYRPSQTYDTLTEAPMSAGTSSFGNPSQSGTGYTSVPGDDLYGQSFTSPVNAATVYNVTFYGRFSSGTHNVKAILVLRSNLNIVANGMSNPISIGATAGWYTATFSTPPNISPNTAYVLMIIPDTTSFRLYYTSTSGGNEYYDTTNSYSSPTNPTDAATGTHQYSIYCNCSLVNYKLDMEVQWTGVEYTQQNAQLCIYTGYMSGNALGVDYWNGSWINLCSSLNASNWNNITVALTSSVFTIRFEAGIYSQDVTQGIWNVSAALLHLWTDTYTAEVEFTGSSNLQGWTQLVWLVDSSWNTDSVNVTIQVYNYTLGGYPSSGNGYISYNSSATAFTDELGSQTLTSGATQFRNSTSPYYWKVKIKGVKSTSTPLQMKLNWIELQDSYAYVGENVPYKAWIWYTIQATGVSGNPIPYTYVSLYANGTTVTFQNAMDGTSVPNPAWLQLDANGTFQLQERSITSSGELFVLYATVGTIVQQKIITQAAQ